MSKREFPKVRWDRWTNQSNETDEREAAKTE